jgi:hypothetical protein|tara:strand:- start:65 stop:454 length:390 start_codon:yes stop_codon:yes gene_type:complete
MAKKPDAARGKTTRKGKIKKIFKKLKPGIGKKLGPIVGVGIRGLMDKGPRKVPNPRGEGTRMETGPRKMPNPRGEGTRLDKGPKKVTPLQPKRGPLQKGPRPMRPIRGPKRQAPSPQLVIARRRAKVKR